MSESSRLGTAGHELSHQQESPTARCNRVNACNPILSFSLGTGGISESYQVLIGEAAIVSGLSSQTLRHFMFQPVSGVANGQRYGIPHQIKTWCYLLCRV